MSLDLDPIRSQLGLVVANTPGTAVAKNIAYTLLAEVERLRGNRHVKRLTTELNNHRESLNNQRREYRKLLAQRDAEVERLRGAHKKFASELDFLEPETGRYPELDEMLDPIADAFSAENDHFECARVCEACGEVLASVPCEGCHGSGCGPGTALGAYEECSECAGAGKTHPSCTGASYAGLTEEVERLSGVVERVRESVHAVRHALHLTGTLDPREVLNHITTAMETE